MRVIEFQAKVKEENGVATTFIDRLLVHPVRAKGFRSLNREEIYAG